MRSAMRAGVDANSLRGYRSDLGPFPGMVRGGAGAVIGEVYEVDDATLAALDRLESHPRFYTRTRIALEDGTIVEAYLLSPEQVSGRRVILSGDWRAHRRDRARARRFWATCRDVRSARADL